MKKYVIAYILLFMVLLVLGFTRGIPFGIIVFVEDLHYGINPGEAHNIMLIYNISIMLACFVLAVILTKQKENVLKFKQLLPVIMLICFLFLPVGMIDIFEFSFPYERREFVSIVSWLEGYFM